MTTTYVPANLATSNLYQVRFNLGDTDASSFELQDEEINWAIQLRGNNWGATALCAVALAAKYSRLTSISADGVSQSLGQRVTQFKLIAADYTMKEAIYCAAGILLGVSISAQLAAMSNSDRTPNIFRIGMNDDPPNTIRPQGDPGSGPWGNLGPA
jgi:hypothetical protein